MKHVLVLIAMEAEAQPLIDHLDYLPAISSSFPNSCHKIFSGLHNGYTVSIVTNGKDKKFGVDCVGTTAGMNENNNEHVVLYIDAFPP